MCAMLESAGSFLSEGAQKTKPWLAKRTPDSDPEDENLEDDLEDDDDDELDDDLDDDLIDLDDEFDTEDEERPHPTHPRKYED